MSIVNHTEVKTADLRVGDIIIEASISGSMWHGWDGQRVSSDPVPDSTSLLGYYQFKVIPNNRPEYTERRAADLRWRVVRSSSQSTVQTSKVIDEYPGQCPRCGASAYVGSFEVAHRNEAAASSCPARRK